MGFLIFLIVTCVAVPVGAQLLRLTRLAPESVPERLLMSASVGYVLIGYGTLALGLTRHLTHWSVALMMALLAVAALGNWDLLWEGLLRALNICLRAFKFDYHAPLTAVVLLLLVGTLITALEPPAGRDFDGLAEHLAQASYYARHHQVVPLWHDHHSQFPSNMQMLYSIALLSGSATAAKLFHWFHGLIALGAVFLMGRRFFGSRACTAGTLVLLTCPMFVWLSGVAYVDLALLAYDLLAVLAFLRWHQTGRPADLVLAALLAGCGATVKMQGLALFGILMVAALLMRPGCGVDARSADGGPAGGRRSRRNWLASLKWTVIATLVGVAIAAPWYIRTAVNTGNPFYPFAYSLFGGKHWSADRALAYQRHQLDFGLGELPPQAELDAMPRWRRLLTGPREPWKWLVAPFGLTFMPWEYEVNLGPLQNLLLTSIGPLWLALLPLLLLLRPRPPAVGVTAWLFLPLWLWWFVSMQLGRYLLPMLAILAPAAGFVFARHTRGGRTGAYFLIAAVALQSVAALGVVALLALPALPVVFGLESRQEYLLRNLDVYEPSLYISENTPPDARIATYGEVRTSYFNRDAVWAEYGHSDLIPHETMTAPRQLIARYRELGITHVLLNAAYLPGLMDSPDKTIGLLRAAVRDGLLRPTTTFTLHRQFMLFTVVGEGGP